MERLTRYMKSGVADISAKEYREKATRDAIQRLAAYEDAEEQGLLVVLPMQLGTPLFEVRKIFGEPSLITKAFDKSVSLWEMERLAKELGKTVFLTQEEAEAALANEKRA